MSFPFHILINSPLSSFSPINLDIWVLFVPFAKLVFCFEVIFKKGKEESCIYLRYSDPSRDTTLPRYICFIIHSLTQLNAGLGNVYA